MSPACNPLPPHRAALRSPGHDPQSVTCVHLRLLAKAIQTAFASTFGTDTVIRMCWAHAEKKMQTRVEQSVQKKSQKEILQDIDALQCASTQEIFDRASENFWTSGNLKTILVRILKTVAHTKSFLFLVIASDIVKDWSNEYITNTERRFAKLPTVSLKTWTESYQWAKLSKQVPLKNSTELVCSYRIPAVLDLECKNFEKPWETFDEYKEQHFREWEVIMPRKGKLVTRHMQLPKVSQRLHLLASRWIGDSA
ncbi:hypothetical protein EVAR_102206_1 [Eumeta japonica]|uniref:Uncharacterized protein n=1 Tax=Eumeta variegata TaxID=151549 RepID=A0A4C1WDY0_EUMVA|nr:hypothetical protein EVAR_102206_1 [Eumeta japonica]